MFNRAKRFYVFRNEPKKFLSGGGGTHRRAIQFYVRKFPQMRVHHAFGSLTHEEVATILDDERSETARSGGGAFVEIGKFAGPTMLEGEAVF